MSELTDAIQSYLLAVESERARRARDPLLASRVLEVKRYQHARFSATYRDWLEAPASEKAARFFLDEIYGPTDFSRRDAEFSRAAPKVAALFPGEIGHILLQLSRLHALSEGLDSAMGAAVTRVPVSDNAYRQAWVAVGQAEARAEQIELVQQIGLTLSRQVQKPLVRATLRMMRGPAQAAGLGSLQAVLEKGFDAFRDLPDANEFVLSIARREREIAVDLFRRGQ